MVVHIKHQQFSSLQNQLFHPAYPAIIPQETPITRATPVATKPTSNEILAP